MSDDEQPLEEYLDHLRGRIQVKLARAGAPADRATLQMVCLAIAQTVMDPSHLRLMTTPPPTHLVPALESIFASIEAGFADEIAELHDVIADAQEDPVWQAEIALGLQAAVLSGEISVEDHIVRLLLSQFVELPGGRADDGGGAKA